MAVTAKGKRAALLVAFLLAVIVGAGLAAPYLWQRFGYVEVRRMPETYFPLVRVILRNRLTGAEVLRLRDDRDQLLFRGRDGVQYGIIEEFAGDGGRSAMTINRNALDQKTVSYGISTGLFTKLHGQYSVVDEQRHVVFTRGFDADALKGTPLGSVLPRDRYQGVETEDGREGVWTFWDALGKVEFQYLYKEGKRREARIAPPWWNNAEDKR